MQTPEAIVRLKIVAALPDIIEAVIGKAKEGSYLHAKFLCELAGIQCGPEARPAESDEEAVIERTVREMLGG